MPTAAPSADRRSPRGGLIAALALTCWLPVSPAGAEAAFPGAGGRIAFTRGVEVSPTTIRFGIDVVQARGGGERRLVAGAQWPAWAPDGRHFAYVMTGPDGRGRGIAIANADGSDRRMVTTDRDDAAPAWSPDGRRLVFHRFRRPAPGVIAPTIHVVRVDGTGRRKVAAGIYPAWGAGGRIAFAHRVSTQAPFFDGIQLVRSDGNGLRHVTSRASDNAPDWSPDGTRIVFTRGRAVYEIGSDGRRLRRVVRVGEWPAWSPDGKHIVYTQGQAIHTVRRNGTARRVLTRPRNHYFGAADWQPVPLASGGHTASVTVYFGRPSSRGRCDRVVARRRTVWSPAVLRGALDALLWGPSSAERAAGDRGWFSSRTASMVRGVRLSGGVARIDFRDLRPIIPNASTSCGSQGLLAQLDRTATQFPTVHRAVYSMNGSRRAFYEWLQLVPPG